MTDIKISAIIPVAPDREPEILESIEAVKYDKSKYEVIVEIGTNASANRNKAPDRSNGEILAFLDDDAVIDEMLFREAELFFAEHPKIDIVGGPQLTPPDDTYFARAAGAALSSYFVTHEMSLRYRIGKLNLNASENHLTSANLFVRRTSFYEIGGFNTDLWPGEDPEFLARAKKKGFCIAYNPEMILYHRRRSNLSATIKQFFNYGRVRPKKEKISESSTNFIFYIPALFMLYIILLPLLFIINTNFLFPAIFYTIANLIVSFNQTIRNGFFLFPMTFIIIFVIHLSYGAGLASSSLTKA